MVRSIRLLCSHYSHVMIRFAQVAPAPQPWTVFVLGPVDDGEVPHGVRLDLPRPSTDELPGLRPSLLHDQRLHRAPGFVALARWVRVPTVRQQRVLAASQPPDLGAPPVRSADLGDRRHGASRDPNGLADLAVRVVGLRRPPHQHLGPPAPAAALASVSPRTARARPWVGAQDVVTAVRTPGSTIASASTVISPFESMDTAKLSSCRVAGPVTTSPSPVNTEPWHAQVS